MSEVGKNISLITLTFNLTNNSEYEYEYEYGHNSKRKIFKQVYWVRHNLPHCL